MRLQKHKVWSLFPANTRRRPNVGLLLARRLRRRPNIKTTLAQRLVLLGSGDPLLTVWLRPAVWQPSTALSHVCDWAVIRWYGDDVCKQCHVLADPVTTSGVFTWRLPYLEDDPGVRDSEWSRGHLLSVRWLGRINSWHAMVLCAGRWLVGGSYSLAAHAQHVHCQYSDCVSMHSVWMTVGLLTEPACSVFYLAELVQFALFHMSNLRSGP